ncbi:hypothetical protein FACS1894164_12010 [Spirochaetia bacterium]|nr:hypothetical protein FACS1894164_12010 [Spirochaetia bacterium]
MAYDLPEDDPEFAALLGTDFPDEEDELAEELPDEEFFDEDEDLDQPELVQKERPTLSALEKLPEITKRFADTPVKTFSDPNYYKDILTVPGEITARINTLLQKYANATDIKDRGVFRQQLIPVYWDFLIGVARHTAGKISAPQKNLLRFGIIHPNLLNAEAREFFSKLIVENEYSQPVHYIDEWFQLIGTGQVKNSSTDEVQVKSSGSSQIRGLIERANGKFDGARNLLSMKSEERAIKESQLDRYFKLILSHTSFDDIPGVSMVYNEMQRQSIVDTQDIFKDLLRIDRETATLFKEYEQARRDVNELKERLRVEELAETNGANLKVLDSEFNVVRQMAKMTVGRQGNHFPIITSEYFRCLPNEIAYRENVLTILAKIESIDPEAFCRVYKNQMNRIIPYVILVPSYGDSGVCWEPFDRFNRATSRGRIAIPLYPRNLQEAVLSAVADLRWQVAKEKAGYHWMDEGLTGNYYQMYIEKKLKGDLKEFFIQDYTLWITKESEGIPRLERDLRGIFWRYIPFSQEIKEKLKTRSFIYQELYQRDVNRSLSDGY